MTTVPTTATDRVVLRRLDGHLELVCGLDARGRSSLRRQSFRAPVHLSKPFLDATSDDGGGNALVVNVVSPTAGLLDGDQLRVDVAVEPGARLVLTTPAATRVHAMRDGCGGRAEVVQRFRVASGGSLEWWPEPLIPQRGARLLQRTVIELEPGAELLFFEALAPGRVAMGEAFAYEELRFATDLRLGSRLLARERFRLAPGGNGGEVGGSAATSSLDALRRRFPHAYYGGALLVAPGLTWTTMPPDWGEKTGGVPHDGGSACWSGMSTLGGGDATVPGTGAFAVRLVAADSVTFRRTLNALRNAVHRALDRRPPALRRSGG